MTDYLEQVLEETADALGQAWRRLEIALAGLAGAPEGGAASQAWADALRQAAQPEGEGTLSPGHPALELDLLRAPLPAAAEAEPGGGALKPALAPVPGGRPPQTAPELGLGEVFFPAVWEGEPRGGSLPAAPELELFHASLPAAAAPEGSGGSQTAAELVQEEKLPLLVQVERWERLESGRFSAAGAGLEAARPRSHWHGSGWGTSGRPLFLAGTGPEGESLLSAAVPGGAVRGQGLEELAWAEQVDRVFRRDSRRYDGGFFLY